MNVLGLGLAITGHPTRRRPQLVFISLTTGTFCAVTYYEGSEVFRHCCTFWWQMMHWAPLDHQTDSTVDTPVVSWVYQPSASTVLPPPILPLHTTPSLTNKGPLVFRPKMYILPKWYLQTIFFSWPSEQSLYTFQSGHGAPLAVTLQLKYLGAIILSSKN